MTVLNLSMNTFARRSSHGSGTATLKKFSAPAAPKAPSAANVGTKVRAALAVERRGATIWSNRLAASWLLDFGTVDAAVVIAPPMLGTKLPLLEALADRAAPTIDSKSSPEVGGAGDGGRSSFASSTALAMSVARGGGETPRASRRRCCKARAGARETEVVRICGAAGAAGDGAPSFFSGFGAADFAGCDGAAGRMLLRSR